MLIWCIISCLPGRGTSFLSMWYKFNSLLCNREGGSHMFFLLQQDNLLAQRWDRFVPLCTPPNEAPAIEPLCIILTSQSQPHAPYDYCPLLLELHHIRHINTARLGTNVISLFIKLSMPSECVIFNIEYLHQYKIKIWFFCWLRSTLCRL